MRITILVIGLLSGLCAAIGQQEEPPAPMPRAAEATYRERFTATQANLTATGASSCSSSQCHGGAKPRPGEVFLGIEYDLWYERGRGTHFRAYKVLYEDERSGRMARLLFGPDAVAKERSECLTCHALEVEPERRGRAFDLEDGVSCEACHGRSEKWNGPHQNPAVWRKERTTDQRTADGFYDTRSLVHRAEQCLSCHMGTADKAFGHRLLAAGHPPLTFELAGDQFNVPKHWRDEQSYLRPEEGSWFHVRAWAVGQAVTLREEMRRLANWAGTDADIDYAVFECYACHHDLKTPSWRQRHERLAKLGEPVVDMATWAMCDPLIEVILPERHGTMRWWFAGIAIKLSERPPDRDTVRKVAESAVEIADELAERASQTEFTRADTLRIMRSLLGRRERNVMFGYRAGAQTFAALYALYRLGIGESGSVPENHEAILKTLSEIKTLLYDERGGARSGEYDPFELIEKLAEVERLLGAD